MKWHRRRLEVWGFVNERAAKTPKPYLEEIRSPRHLQKSHATRKTAHTSITRFNFRCRILSSRAHRCQKLGSTFHVPLPNSCSSRPC